MNPPYTCRLMAALPNHTPVELARFHRPLLPDDWRAHTSGMAREWIRWVETPLKDSECLSSRPKLHYHNRAEKISFHLSAEEKGRIYERA